jgi:hypothetical protein
MNLRAPYTTQNDPPICCAPFFRSRLARPGAGAATRRWAPGQIDSIPTARRVDPAFVASRTPLGRRHPLAEPVRRVHLRMART